MSEYDEYDVHGFCLDCGAHRRRLPFGSYSRFFDKGPCGKCGFYNRDGFVVRRAQVGRWPWQRDWVTRDGERLDLRSRDREDG